MRMLRVMTHVAFPLSLAYSASGTGGTGAGGVSATTIRTTTITTTTTLLGVRPGVSD